MSTSTRPSVTGELGIAIFREFRKVKPTLSIQWAAAFMYVASNPGCRAKDIAEHLGVASGAVSMIMSGMGDKGLKESPGLKLLDVYEHPTDWRAAQIELSARGKHLLATMEAAHFSTCKELVA